MKFCKVLLVSTVFIAACGSKKDEKNAEIRNVSCTDSQLSYESNSSKFTIHLTRHLNTVTFYDEGMIICELGAKCTEHNVISKRISVGPGQFDISSTNSETVNDGFNKYTINFATTAKLYKIFKYNGSNEPHTVPNPEIICGTN